jgi:hypothetical protein
MSMFLKLMRSAMRLAHGRTAEAPVPLDWHLQGVPGR